MTGDLRRDVVGPAAEGARDRDGHRLIWLGVAGALICFLMLGGLFIWRTAELQSQADALSGSVSEQHQAAQALSDQVRELGGTPTIQPPAVAGAAGPAGATGPQGVQGVPGQKGDKGDTGQAGKDGQSPPCLSTPAQCQGAAGVAGQNGADGQPGQPGKDGVDGKDGATGPAGPVGPTCPNGYTLTPVIVVATDGATHQGLVCVANSSTPGSSNVRKG